MKKEIAIKTCDICQQNVEMFCNEQPYNEYLDISLRRSGSVGCNHPDICLKCNEKIINFINFLPNKIETEQHNKYLFETALNFLENLNLSGYEELY